MQFALGSRVASHRQTEIEIGTGVAGGWGGYCDIIWHLLGQRCMNRQTNGQTDRQTYGQTYKWTDRVTMRSVVEYHCVWQQRASFAVMFVCVYLWLTWYPCISLTASAEEALTDLELIPPPGAKWMELLIKGGTGADSRHMVTHTDTLSHTLSP